MIPKKLNAILASLYAFLLLPATSGISNPPVVGGLPQDGGGAVFYQTIANPPLPDALEFAGEPVPLHYFDVREALQRELTVLCYWHASMIHTLQLANRFFPIIEPVLREEGVPDDFKYLCVAESNLQQAVSPMKAVGFWQFLEQTAKEYGLEITAEIDERYHIEKATRAACAYLKKAREKYGSWSMAAASYNTGQKNLDRYIAQQHQTSYYNLLLPEETGRYLFRAAVFKLIHRAPARYGFHLQPDDLFKPLRWTEVKITGAIDNWAAFAAGHGTNYKIFKYFNPWLRDAGLVNANKKTYVVKIPTRGFRELE
ncbi:MAG: lytic transglycosylase domain-containing protein [Prevotellaceae bacterium]|jgi:hypothetical protein|nr:lytic transglycosylase domain-containing protein [Prevotellaceae bacterium]